MLTLGFGAENWKKKGKILDVRAISYLLIYATFTEGCYETESWTVLWFWTTALLASNSWCHFKPKERRHGQNVESCDSICVPKRQYRSSNIR